MKIAFCSDHRGFGAKEQVKDVLIREGHEIIDYGCTAQESCDYPEFSFKAAEAVTTGECELGVFFCGTGIGMSITANKVRGIRAALVHDELTAAFARKHNNANALCIPADLLGEELIRRIIHVYIETPFEGGRHNRRLQMIEDYEQANRK